MSKVQLEDFDAKNLLEFIANKNYDLVSKTIHIELNYDKEIYDNYLEFQIKPLEKCPQFENEIKLCVLLCIMIEDTSNLYNIFQSIYGDVVKEKFLMKALKYYHGMEELIKAKRNMLPKEVGIDIYTIESMCDQRTCKSCEKVQGKEFLLSKAKLGTNFPPLNRCTSDYCRCFPSFDIKD